MKQPRIVIPLFNNLEPVDLSRLHWPLCLVFEGLNMRNMFLAFVLSFVALSANAEMIGDWVYTSGDISFVSADVQHDKGSNSINIAANGYIWISFFTAGTEGDLNPNTVVREKRVVNVNGQNVNFIFEFYDNGHVSAVPASNQGKAYIMEQAKAASYLALSGKGWFFTVSAKGFKKAWQRMQGERAI